MAGPTKRIIDMVTGEETVVEMSFEEVATLGQSSKIRVPDQISGRQCRLYLNRHTTAGGLNMLSEVRKAINGIPDETQRLEAQIEFEHAEEFKRSHPLIMFAATALGLTDDQVDQAFRDAILI